METAQHAGYAQNANSYLSAKHRTLKSFLPGCFLLYSSSPKSFTEKTVSPIDEWIFLRLLLKSPHADVLASGAQGMGLPRNPVTAIS